MRNLLRRYRGRIRLARGRCPSCASEPAQIADCRVCRGYSGPFPINDSTVLRWAWRFEGEFVPRRAAAQAPVVEPAWSPASHRAA